MEPEIQRNLENLHANEMLKELKTLFPQQAEQELLQNICEIFTLASRKKGRYPKETMGYSFYCPPENKVLVAQNVKFLKNSLITQEVSGSLKDLEIIQEGNTHPSIDTSLNHEEDDLKIDEPQSDIIPIRRSIRTRRPTDHLCLYIDVEDHELRDLEVYMEQPEGFVNLKYPNQRYYMENSKCGSIPMQEKLRLSISQGASTPAELKRMQNVPYALAVSSIMYAVRCTRPDVAFAQNGSIADGAPLVSVSAQMKSFDVNKLGSAEADVKGGVAGESILKSDVPSLTLFGLVTGDCLSCSGVCFARMYAGYDPCRAAKHMLITAVCRMLLGLSLLSCWWSAVPYASLVRLLARGSSQLFIFPLFHRLMSGLDTCLDLNICGFFLRGSSVFSFDRALFVTG
nr:retrovirus-related Pol polyprotein from transposon TNT 1-94 [Tanacetum cinerariifolium]